jgi:hypothetical protein
MVDIPTRHDRYDGSLPLHDERTHGLDDVRFRSSGSRDEDASDSALDILNKRYARGEINKEEYEEKKRVIGRQD